MKYYISATVNLFKGKNFVSAMNWSKTMDLNPIESEEDVAKIQEEISKDLVERNQEEGNFDNADVKIQAFSPYHNPNLVVEEGKKL